MPQQRINSINTQPQPSPSSGQRPVGQRGQAMSPGDEAPAGTPGTGENVCRNCAGTGQIDDQPCPDCSGTGYVITGIGGA